MFKPIQTAFASASLAAALALAPVAHADTASFSYGDLDLTTPAGQEELSRRIETAARRACTAEAPTGTRIRKGASLNQCMAEVRRQVESRLAMKSASESRGR